MNMPPRLVYWIGVVLILSTSTACTSQIQILKDTFINESQPATTTPSTTAQAARTTQAPQPRPATKTVKDEWTQKKLILTLYQREGVPVTTYYPKQDFIVEDGDSGEGTGVWFYATVGPNSSELSNAQSAYVHLFFPANPTTLKQMQKAIVGKRGLMETNNWEITGRADSAIYPWVKHRIDFVEFTPTQNQTGSVYIGEYKGKAFRVTTHHPIDAGDGFVPRANLILKNLQFQG
jgi:hypothetical protein